MCWYPNIGAGPEGPEGYHILRGNDGRNFLYWDITLNGFTCGLISEISWRTVVQLVRTNIIPREVIDTVSPEPEILGKSWIKFRNEMDGLLGLLRATQEALPRHDACADEEDNVHYERSFVSTSLKRVQDEFGPIWEQFKEQINAMEERALLHQTLYSSCPSPEADVTSGR